MKHVRKSGAEPRVIGSGQGIFAHQVDVVPDEGQIARLMIRMNAPRRIGEDDPLDPPSAQRTDRMDDGIHGQSFIGVKPAGQAGHGYAVDGADQQLPLVAEDRGDMEIRDVAEWDTDGLLQQCCGIASSRTQDDGQARFQACLLL